MAIRSALLPLGQIIPRVTIGRVTPCIPRERPDANTCYCRLFKATTAYTSACTDAGAALAPLLIGEPGYATGNPPKDYGQIRGDSSFPWMIAVDYCFRTMPYSIQQTEQIPNDPPRMGAKSTTTSNHPSTPINMKDDGDDAIFQ